MQNTSDNKSIKQTLNVIRQALEDKESVYKDPAEDVLILDKLVRNDGTIDIIGSFHTPQDEESKRLPFAQAASGSIGIETLLPLALELYHNNSLPLDKIVKCLTINPAKILKINKKKSGPEMVTGPVYRTV